MSECWVGSWICAEYPAQYGACRGGLGILIGLGTVSNLETSLETIWLVPGLGSGPDWAWARFLEDDILCRR